MTGVGEAAPPMEPAKSRRQDFVVVTKAKLSLLVVFTAGAGFISAWPGPGWADFWKLFQTLAGTTLTAFGASVFNQLMEADADRRMKRTEDRPVAAGRLPAAGAFVLGWILSAWGIVHLAVMVGTVPAMLAGLTLAIYIFAYTPLKRRSSANTVVGAVTGGIPPVIGWTAAGGELGAGALWWFFLLFVWQLPHFYAINWIHREEYRRAGFIMLANEDDSGRKTARWSWWSALLLAPLMVAAPWVGLTHWWFLLPASLATAYLLFRATAFQRERTVTEARKLFFVTLLYLPVLMGIALVFDRD